MNKYTSKLTTSLFIIAVLILSSCSTVHKNGYYQTKRYKTKNIALDFKNKSKKRKQKEVIGEKQMEDYAEELASKKVLKSEAKSQLKTETVAIETLSVAKESLENHAELRTIDKIKTTSLVKHQRSIKEAIKSTVKPGNKTQTPTSDTVQRVHWGAVAGFVLSIMSFVIFGLLFSILAIIFCAIALRKIKEEPEVYSGRGLAIAGLVLGIVALFLTILLIGAIAATAV